MTMSALYASLLVGGAAFFLVLGITNLFRAIQAREKLIMEAEERGAAPEFLSDPLRRQSFIARWSDRYDRSERASPERERLRKAYLAIKPSDYRVLRIAMGGALIYICISFFGLLYLPSILLGVAAYIFVPKLVFSSRRSAYTKAFNAQLTEITLLLANSLRAGMSIQQGLSQVVERVPEPAKSEFRQTYNELQLGDNLAQSLQSLRQRINSRDLDVVVNAIVIQHQAGGNLARVLTAMSNILTERNRLTSEINSLTTEARFSALIVMIIPVALLLMLRTTPLGEALFTSVTGWILLTLFGLSQLGIFIVIQRMSRIEV